jgi:3-hydroxyacyl-CoA dehydrogenase
MIGSGLVGRSWAIVFSRAGWDVALQDSVAGAAERALKLVEDALTDLAQYGLVDDPKAAAKRVRVAKSVSDALDGVSHVQESTFEDVEVKRKVFAELDAVAPPDAILASSTSAIRASLFTENLKGRGRCLIGHPVNPPHLAPIVEIIGAPWTTKESVAKAKQIYESVRQVPVIVNKEIEGFVINRLQGALLAEAFRLAGEGYISPQDLDKTIKHGLGLRWSFIGPFETIELNAPGGLPDYCERFTGFYKRVQATAATPAVFEGENMARILAQWPSPSKEELEKKSRWRDRRLAGLAAHKRDAPD